MPFFFIFFLSTKLFASTLEECTAEFHDCKKSDCFAQYTECMEFAEDEDEFTEDPVQDNVESMEKTPTKTEETDFIGTGSGVIDGSQSL